MRTRIRAYDQHGRMIHEWISPNTPDPDRHWDTVIYTPEYGNEFPSKIGVDYVPNKLDAPTTPTTDAPTLSPEEQRVLDLATAQVQAERGRARSR